MAEPKWYIVHTYSGYEEKVKANIEERIIPMGMQENIFEVIIPIENVIERKNRKKKIIQKKFLPGYVLVHMDLTEKSWHIIKTTDKVAGFVGSGPVPRPLLEKEIEAILGRMKEGESAPKQKVGFEKGENVRIMEGPFVNFSGMVEEVNGEKGRLRVMVSIFGRSTPVELDFLQVEKI